MTWTFQPVGGFWFTSIAVAVLLALVWVVPRPRPSGGKLLALRALRLAVVLLVLVALLRPTLTRIEKKPLEASLLVLVDESRSMQVEDSLGGASRWRAAKRMLDDAADDLATLADQWEVRVFRFGSGVTEATITDGAIPLPSEPTGEATALGDALAEALDRGGGQRLLGVVLLSDGAQRALPPADLAPQVAVRRLAAENVPLYATTFGQPGVAGRPDLAIEDLTTSSSAFVKAPNEVTARLRVTGYANRRLTVQMLWEDGDGEMQVVASEQIRTGPRGGGYPVRLVHTPLEPGEHKITVRVAAADGELVTSNNQQSTFISVRDGGVKVLYLAGAQRAGGVPGLEQRFVRSSLAASPDIFVARQVFDYRQPRRVLEFDASQGKPDVFLIDNLDATALSDQSWREMADQVRKGAGLGMIGGRQSFGPGGYSATRLAAILPVEVSATERQRLTEPRRRDVHIEGPITMRPAKPFGLGHPILQLASGEAAPGDAIWSELPTLDGANRFDRSRLKPNAMVLLETGGDPARPLLVVGQSGEGRVLASAIDTTWRWRLEGFGDAHRRFWRQAVLWLARKDDSSQSPVWIDLDSRLVTRGGRLDMRIGVRTTGSGDPSAGDLRYEAIVDAPDGKKVDLATGGGEETAAMFAATGAAGDYTVRVTGFRGETKLGDAQARFSVPGPGPRTRQPGRRAEHHGPTGRRDVRRRRPGNRPGRTARPAPRIRRARTRTGRRSRRPHHPLGHLAVLPPPRRPPRHGVVFAEALGAGLGPNPPQRDQDVPTHPTRMVGL